MNEAEKKRWESLTSEHAQGFNWWWRGEGWKDVAAKYSLTPIGYQSYENYQKLWIKLRRAAFNYELCARREHSRKWASHSLYEHELPFCDLKRPAMEKLLKRWPGEECSLLEDEECPSDVDLALLEEQRKNG